ncbi:MAG: hypothetical protein M0006_06375 [Magnetospirillum sp.]|nr:hypothetical protein [Magnetospirillum sp.]
MRAIGLACLSGLLSAATPALASQLVYAPTVGGGGGFAIENSNKSGSVVVPGVAGGLTIFNSDKSITTIVPTPLAGFIAQGGLTVGRQPSYGIGGVFVGTGGGAGGVIVNGSQFGTLGSGFCAPPCAVTPDGVAPDGSVVTPVP